MPLDKDQQHTQPMNTSPSAFNTPFPPEGCDFGRYKNMVVVGEGGMGRVFKAQDPVLDIEVAVKVIPRGLHASKEERMRFMREIRLLAGLTIPGVVRLFDCGECEGWQYYAMEFLEGHTLDDYVEQHNLTIEQRLAYIKELAEILQKLHDQGIIHRDLKPSNVIITQSGEIRLTDFGIAKRFNEERAETAITMMDSRPGTPYYMSPEPSNVLKDLAMAKKADVYSMAVMAYELLTNRLPYDVENLTVTECILVIREEPPCSFKDRQVDIPLDIDILIMSALDKDPDKRPDAGTFARRLDAILQSNTSSAPGAGSNRLMKLAAMLLLTAAFAGLLYSWYNGKQQATGVASTSTHTGTATTSTTDSAVIETTDQVVKIGAGTPLTDGEQADKNSETSHTAENGTDTTPTTVTEGDDDDVDNDGGDIEDTMASEKQYAAAVALADSYLQTAKWSEAEAAYLSLQRIPGYETNEKTAVGVRQAKRGRLLEATQDAVKREDWETVKTLADEVLTLIPDDLEAQTFKKQAIAATTPILTINVTHGGRQLEHATVIFDNQPLGESTTPVRLKVEKQGRHSLVVLAKRTTDRVFLPYRNTVYIANRPMNIDVKLDALKTRSVNDINMDMIPVASGQFNMGGAKGVSGKPGTLVNLTRHFWMSKYEVNQDQYYTIMRQNPSSVKGERYPVTRVSWNDASLFCRKLNTRESRAGRLLKGYEYRLPTEAEWEYTYKADTGLKHPFKLDADIGRKVNCRLANKQQYADIGYGSPNAWGIYNMPGNVREWVLDNYDSYTPSQRVDPKGPSKGVAKVVRGGSWSSSVEDCSSLNRDRSVSANRAYSDVGFRIVLGPKL